ncbi:unnamed protein product [Heligmosomoides polygyrus]|uniref:SET domain bifurcated histone lysine methyltransferase 2 n=1 Tax=Heligmosomoides polygyrus TaxID=6339 RepID=A0A3P7Y279_HELPZ|nr:unnamed protein product [Heligmosomoides polygyrus]
MEVEVINVSVSLFNGLQSELQSCNMGLDIEMADADIEPKSGSCEGGNLVEQVLDNGNKSDTETVLDYLDALAKEKTWDGSENDDDEHDASDERESSFSRGDRHNPSDEDESFYNDDTWDDSENDDDDYDRRDKRYSSFSHEDHHNPSGEHESYNDDTWDGSENDDDDYDRRDKRYSSFSHEDHHNPSGEHDSYSDDGDFHDLYLTMFDIDDAGGVFVRFKNALETLKHNEQQLISKMLDDMTLKEFQSLRTLLKVAAGTMGTPPAICRGEVAGRDGIVTVTNLAGRGLGQLCFIISPNPRAPPLGKGLFILRDKSGKSDKSDWSDGCSVVNMALFGFYSLPNLPKEQRPAVVTNDTRKECDQHVKAEARTLEVEWVAKAGGCVFEQADAVYRLQLYHMFIYCLSESCYWI